MQNTLSHYLTILLTTSIVWAQMFITDPNTEDGPAYVFAEKGTFNISLYCEVNNNGRVQTRWRIKRKTDNNLIIPDFNGAGQLISPADLVGKITAIGDVIPGISLTFETNLTIINFTSEFNLALIQCAQSFPGTLREFNLGFPGKMKYGIFHHILFMY